MKNQSKMFFAVSFIAALMCVACADTHHSVNEQAVTQPKTKKKHLQIILGSTRQGRTSEKIAQAAKKMLEKNNDFSIEVVDLRDYNLPFLADEVPPASREVITDPAVKRWSDKISEADAFIIVVPEYNSGYPGVLKNALDSLYKEWNNKPVALIGYSGGPSGATNAIAQLRQVTTALQMINVDAVIKVPTAWKAFDARGHLENKNIEAELNKMVSQLAQAHKTVKK